MNTIKIYLTSGGRIADLHKDFPLFQGQYQNKLLNVFVPTTILSPNFAIQHFIGTLTSETTPQNGVLDGFVVSQLGREKAKGDTIYAVVGTTTTDYFVYVFDGNEWTSEQVNYFNPTRVAGTNVDIGCISTQRNGSVAKSKTYAMRFVKTLTYQNEEYALYERKLPQEFTYYSGQGTNAPTIVVNVVNVDLNENKVISIITSQTCSLDVMPSTVLDNDEVIEPSEYEQINATLNTLTEELATKQNKAIPNSSTSAKTVEGAINELDTRSKQNTSTSSSNTIDIMELQEDVAEIKGMLITGEEFIGTLTVQDNLPTDQVLDNFVLQTEGRAVAGGDVVIVIVQKANETNRNYKYIYNGSAWSYYEIPLIETAKNGILGIVKGTYGVANYNTLVNIVDGEIRNIYIKKNNEYVDMSNLLATTSITLDDIMTGATAVPKANQDGNGNNIADTYLTKNLGASKQFVKDYALPVEFNDVHYLNILSGATSYQKTISANSDRKQVATALGETEIFSATYSLTDTQFQLSNNNRFINKFYITLSSSETVYFRLITSVKKQGQALTQASAILTDSISITANTITAIHIDGNMSDISKVVEMTDGDQITQTLEIVRDTGSTNTATIVSNTTYPSTFYLTTVGKTISVENALKGEITAINTQSIVIDNGVAYAPFGLTEDLVENAEYQFNIPIDDTLDTSLRLFLRADNINYEIITPYGTTTAYISDLNQTKTANGTYRFTAIFQNNTFVIEQSNLNGILTPSALATIIKGSDTISVDENEQGTELVISLDADVGEKIVEITGYTSPATQGTLTEEQLATLQASKNNSVLFNGEKYYFMDDRTSEGYLIYAHAGHNATNQFMIMCFTITLNTRGFVITELNITDALNNKIANIQVWDATKQYKVGDIVYVKDTSSASWYTTVYKYYVAKQDNIGEEPTESSTIWDDHSAPAASVPQLAGGGLNFVIGLSNYGGAIGLGLRARATNATAEGANNVVVTDDYKNIYLGEPVYDNHATTKKFVEDLVATKSLYLHKYVLSGSSIAFTVRLITNIDTAFTTTQEIFQNHHTNIVSITGYEDTSVIVIEDWSATGISYIITDNSIVNVAYGNLTISGTPTITQLN